MSFRRVRFVLCGLLAAAAAVPAPLPAQSPARLASAPNDAQRAAQAVQVFRDWARRAGISQGAIAVAHHGRVVGQAGVGGRHPDMPAPVASLSKAVTALCVARLADAGRLRYEDRVGALLGPWFRRHGLPADRRLLDVTVSELLTHRSGMVRDGALPYFAGGWWSAPGSLLDSRVGLAIRDPLQFAPGRRYFYSNQGYALLSLIIEQVSGRDYETQCRDSVLRPLGIANAFLGRTAVQQALSGSGGWWIAATDYARLASLIGPASPGLGPPTRRWLADRLRQGSYGLGFEVDGGRFGTPTLSHTGLLLGTEVNASALFVTWPDGWSVALNTSPAADPALGALRRRLAGIMTARTATAQLYR